MNNVPGCYAIPGKCRQRIFLKRQATKNQKKGLPPRGSSVEFRMKNRSCPAFFAAFPAVYTTENVYQIFIPVREASVMWATVEGQRFDDARGGVLRSGTLCHKVTVPMELLDRAGEYTLHWRRIPERKPYFTEAGDEETVTFCFRPVPETGNLRLCHLSDTHGLLHPAVHAAEIAATEETDKAVGEKAGVTTREPSVRTPVPDGFDLILFTGDVHNHNGGETEYHALPRLVSELAHGEIPIVYARGNHDTRGAFAEHLPEIAPTVGGAYYYTFRLGGLWGLVLDCGEDKPDNHPEYGFVNDFALYREAESAFLRRLTEKSGNLPGSRETASLSPDAPDIRWRLVISHVPFPFPKEPPFDIERGRYADWCRMIGKGIRPDLMVSGHLHVCEICQPGCERDKEHIQFCPLFLSCRPDFENEVYTCGVLTLTADGILPRYVSSDGTVRTEEKIPLAKRNG